MQSETDLDAPMMPGEAAGGFHIGQSVAELLETGDECFRSEPILNYQGRQTGLTILRTDAVDLWVTKDNTIRQIGVHGAYSGMLFNQITLDMTIDDIERIIGPCAETSEDTLSIYGVRGLGFDVAFRPDCFVPGDLDFQLPELRFSPLTWFFVYEEDETDPWGSKTIARVSDGRRP
ncbi:MAG TPA: hypothetical protein VJO13_15775 [Ktedonobacterales bacterium]|nr:hypothetical protein [Ktedonobacterales bacterium]